MTAASSWLYLDLATDHMEGWPLERHPYHLETSVPGIFAAGDVRAESAKRVASAVGEGAMEQSCSSTGTWSSDERSRYPAGGSRSRAPAIPSKLRTLFLFEELSDEQLAVLCRDGHVELFQPGLGLRRG